MTVGVLSILSSFEMTWYSPAAGHGNLGHLIQLRIQQRVTAPFYHGSQISQTSQWARIRVSSQTTSSHRGL